MGSLGVWGVLGSLGSFGSFAKQKTNFRTQGAETRNVQSSRLLQTVWVGWAVGGQTATDWHLPLKVQILTLKDADSHPSSLNLVDFEILSAGRRAA